MQPNSSLGRERKEMLAAGITMSSPDSTTYRLLQKQKRVTGPSH
jgi:hypothetical protein